MKTVIEMAREADMGYDFTAPGFVAELERYTKIVRADAIADEREACAKLVDHILKEGGGTWGDAIRARGNT